MVVPCCVCCDAHLPSILPCYIILGPKAKGGAKVIIEPHRHAGVFIAKGGKDDVLVTKNMDVGVSVYGEKRISVEVSMRSHVVSLLAATS